MTIKRIGFCCKYIENNAQIAGLKPKDSVRQYAVRTTTLTWMRAQSATAAHNKLWDLTKHNLEAVRKFVSLVAGFEPGLRMARIGSDILPLYTEPTYGAFYKRSDVVDYIAKQCAIIGETARQHDVRLSFHPDQFCVLASANPQTAANSILEMEYHADMARYMGYGAGFHDHGFKINVHISGRLGADGVRAALGKLSPVARNLITIENEENNYGLDQCLALADVLPIVLDTHHHWVHTGDYIAPSDDRIKRVVDSWRGVRPALHYSVSRETVLPGHCARSLPQYRELTARGLNMQQLRAHSDYYWNTAANDYVLGFWDRFDIQCESKAKNLASFKLYSAAHAGGQS